MQNYSIQRNTMNKLIAVTIGDIKGIGIELLIKEWKKKRIKNFVLFTSYKLLKEYINKKKINIEIYKTSIKKNKIVFSKNLFNIYDIKASNSVNNSLLSLKESYNLTRKKYFIGIVTLPINKKKINKINSNFLDQTSYFTKRDNKVNSNMIFIYKNLFFSPLTIHIELRNVAKEIKNTSTIIKKIENLNKTLINDFNIKKPKYVMAGINPHNGEDGLISNEDKDYLNPIIQKLNKKNININGPISPDSVVNKNNLSKYNCFIFTYHDQALIPFKIISNYSGVNFTTNLEIIRVSPDHGTAYDMVGNKKQSSNGIINSFKILKKIFTNRTKYENTKKISRTKLSNW